MSKAWIEIEGQLYNLDMLVEVIPNGPHGAKGYHLKFCNGSFVKFTLDPAVHDCRYYMLAAAAAAIRIYLFDRTLRVVPGPFESDRHQDY